MLAFAATANAGGVAVCGNGIVEQNEICDGQECCSTSCTFVPDGTTCGTPATACQLTSACFDFVCFDGARFPPAAACDDGDPCTVGERCDSAGVCSSTVKRCEVTMATAATGNDLPGKTVVVVDCDVPGAAGGACSAAAFLPPAQPAGAASRVAGASTSTDLQCDFTRQITRSVTRPLTGAGTARLKLKLNRLARRLLRRLPASDTVALTVCTKIEFPNGEIVTLVDVVNAARK